MNMSKTSLRGIMVRLVAVSALAACLSGCTHQTGFTFVDYDTADANRIKVTKFTDNSFVARIEYDYSDIPDFQATNVSVTLVRTVIPLDAWWGPNQDRGGYTRRQTELQRRLLGLTTVDEKPLYWYSDRPAIVLGHVPGRISVLSLDDMGAYRLEYGSQCRAK